MKIKYEFDTLYGTKEYVFEVKVSMKDYQEYYLYMAKYMGDERYKKFINNKEMFNEVIKYLIENDFISVIDLKQDDDFKEFIKAKYYDDLSCEME